MLKEITKEEARNRVFDSNVFVLKMSDMATKTERAKYTFTPIVDYGSPKKILEILNSDNFRFLEDTE